MNQQNLSLEGGGGIVVTRSGKWAAGEETDMSKFKIEAGTALDALELAVARLEKLDGTIASDPGGGAKNSSYNARISKELQFIAHLCKKAEGLVMDEFWSFKGESGHERIGS